MHRLAVLAPAPVDAPAPRWPGVAGLAPGALLQGREGAVLDAFNAAGAALLGRRCPLVSAAAAGAVESDRPRLEAAALDILAEHAPRAQDAVLTDGGCAALGAALAAARVVTGRARAIELGPDPVRLAARLARGDVAAVVADPAALDAERARRQLDDTRGLCDRYGAVLVLDERCAAPRMAPGGGQALWRVEADLAVYGPALANGHPLGALAGRAELVAAARARRPAVVGSSAGVTSAGAPSAGALAAMAATAVVLRHAPVLAVLQVRGSELQAELGAVLAATGADRFARIVGDPTAVRLEFDHPLLASTALRRFVQRELWREGVLVRGRVHVSFAWADAEVSRMVDACRVAFAAAARSVATWERCRPAAA